MATTYTSIHPRNGVAAFEHVEVKSYRSYDAKPINPRGTHHLQVCFDGVEITFHGVNPHIVLALAEQMRNAANAEIEALGREQLCRECGRLLSMNAAGLPNPCDTCIPL
jgi:hypothetical protein